MSVYQLRFGTPEAVTPRTFAPEPKCDVLTERPADLPAIEFQAMPRGCVLRISIPKGTDLYGFGLQLQSFVQNGKKKHIRPNADPKSDSGDSHAPVPFFVTTAGFGIYVDTARYASFYCNVSKKPDRAPQSTSARMDMNDMIGTNAGDTVVVDVPIAQGADVYYITGDTVGSIVAQYNLLSGGGCLPPMWGLGNFYRCDMTFCDRQILSMARDIRAQSIPCDVLGLEPGWQTHAYSCSYLWDTERFPNASDTVRELKSNGYHINLWEHAFVHPSSPIYERMLPHSGDCLVWNGLVPDFAAKQARDVFCSAQKPHIDMGIDGFKLDECDGSDFTGGWSFPNCASFPSGLDGEQYHSLFGTLYAQTVQQALGKPTYSSVRNMGALASSYPFVLYSDLYGHKEFITGVVNASLSGLLWSPEVRHAENAEDLLRRIQTVVFSVQSLVNAFYLPVLPWVQHGCVEEARALFELRMSLLPYLYTAFFDYKTTGKPPVRALICDYQNEQGARNCSDEWMFGDAMLVAPIVYPEKGRDVFLPDGVWYDFFTNERFAGGVHRVETQGIPVFVKEGTLLPLASPVSNVSEDVRFDITLRAFGDCAGAVCRLAEDGRIAEIRIGDKYESKRYKIN